MDVSEQERVVSEANILGMSVKKITDQLRETEAINDTLRDTTYRQDAEIARKDEIIADLSAKLDDALADLATKHDALIDINARVRETFARQRGTGPKQQQLTGAPARQLPPEQPMPRIVRQGPAVG